MNIELQKYVENTLNTLGCDYFLRDEKLIISEELQVSRHTYPELPNIKFPFVVTEYNYPCSLSKQLQDLNNLLENKFDVYFEQM